MNDSEGLLGLSPGDCSRGLLARLFNNSKRNLFCPLHKVPLNEALNLRRRLSEANTPAASDCVPTGIKNGAEKGHVCTARPAWINIKSQMKMSVF